MKTMRKMCKIFGIAALLLSAAVFCLACGSGNAPVAPPIDPPAQTPDEPLPPVPVYYTLRYEADLGGNITGELVQCVLENKQASVVRAVPDTGYVFTGWSDGLTDAERIDLSVADKTVTAQFRYAFDGQGTEQSPYLISSYQALQDMRQHPNAHYLLTQDLALNGIAHTPLFNDATPFCGVFDGNGHTIQNLTVEADTPFPSLFGCADGDILRLNVTDFCLTIRDSAPYSSLYAGAVCAVTNGKLADIQVSGIIRGRDLHPARAVLGGLAGAAYGTVQNCNADINMQIVDTVIPEEIQDRGIVYVGGLIGRAYGNVLSCHAAGEIAWTIETADRNGGGYIGGLIGAMQLTDAIAELTVSDCVSNVAIQSTHSNAGGAIGYCNAPATAVHIENCHADGNITLTESTGGGFAYQLFLGDRSTVLNCYATGNVRGKSADGFAHDISSRNGSVTVQNCYATGNILAQSHANGFSDGLNDVLAVNCYSVSQVMTVNGKGTATGFSNSIYGNIRNCYAICDVTGVRSCGFSLHTSGTIQECYSSGTVYSMKAATAFILTVYSGTVINCYSSSDIVMTNEDINTAILAGGLAEVNNGSILNCYYSGKISGTTTQNTNMGTIVSHNRGTVRNCHWLYHEDSPAQQAISRNSGTDEYIYRYESKADMYFIADLLNGNTQDVWVNVDSDTPTFKTIL